MIAVLLKCEGKTDLRVAVARVPVAGDLIRTLWGYTCRVLSVRLDTIPLASHSRPPNPAWFGNKRDERENAADVVVEVVS